MINFFNFKKFNNEYLITNDFGNYAFLNPLDFEKLITNQQIDNEIALEELKKKAFVYESSNQSFLDNYSYKMFNSKEYLFSATQLHIFVVTNACNMQCVYCQAQNGEENNNGFMTEQVAKRAVEIALQSPDNHLQFEFQGGEPLLNFDVIKFIVNYSNEVRYDKCIDYSIVTNLTLLDDEMLDFIVNNNISISTSVDGNMECHNENRQYKDGKASYEDVVLAIKKIQEKQVQLGAILTVARTGLKYAKKIIDTYIELGFDSISLRPLSPLGCANKSWETIGYSADEYIAFYIEAMDYLIEKNKKIRIKESLASVFLTKILDGWGSNYMELRSPCGATFGQLAYYYDGNIYTCDEGRMVAEMGDSSFKLGNVFDSNYYSIVDNNVCKGICSASILESLPSCSACIYQPYCGVCPIVNYVLHGDIYEKMPKQYKCKLNKGMLDYIFTRLQEKNSTILEIFWGWIR